MTQTRVSLVIKGDRLATVLARRRSEAYIVFKFDATLYNRRS
jgi:hypothetical protein